MEDNGLFKPEVKESLEMIVGQCFINNRYADRIVSLLSVSYVMPNIANEIHHKIAHMYLGDDGADAISTYMDERNATTVYPQTLVGDQEYSNPIECFEMLLKNQFELENRVVEAISFSKQFGDIMTKSFLEDYLTNLIKYTAVILTLHDKAHQYNITIPENAARFDNHADKFGLDELGDD